MAGHRNVKSRQLNDFVALNNATAFQYQECFSRSSLITTILQVSLKRKPLYTYPGGLADSISVREIQAGSHRY